MQNNVTGQPVELTVGHIISSASSWAVGREFGRPILNDDGTEEGRFDVRFP